MSFLKCPNCDFGMKKGIFHDYKDNIEELIECKNTSCDFAFKSFYPTFKTYVECRDRDRVMKTTGKVI